MALPMYQGGRERISGARIRRMTDRRGRGSPRASCGKQASKGVKLSWPSTRKAFAFQNRTTFTPSITCFTAMDEAPRAQFTM